MNTENGRAPTDAEPLPLAVGDTVLDRYRVVAKLAVGGLSVVYRGQDLRLHRPVCLKVFHHFYTEVGTHKAAYDHFVQEAYAISKLSHPNTLRIYDFGHLPESKNGAPLQVFEFMKGGTLDKLIRREGPMGARQTAKIIMALSGALTEAHELGIVHRDIKPVNILFGHNSSDQSPKLADFGIAKLLSPAGDHALAENADGAQAAGEPSILMYSPQWAAPEQIAGRPVSNATDIYSLALVAVFMLTGRSLFDALTPIESYEQRSRMEERLEKICASSVPEPALHLLQQSLKIDPALRPESVLAFAYQFSSVISGQKNAFASSSEPTQIFWSRQPDLQPAEDREQIAPLQRLVVSDQVQSIQNRLGLFVPLPEDGSVDIDCAQDLARIRLTMFMGPDEEIDLHIKGLNCFVARREGRPTTALQLAEESELSLLTPARDILARVKVLWATRSDGLLVFHIDGQAVAIDESECYQVIALDFGPEKECLFVYHSAGANS